MPEIKECPLCHSNKVSKVDNDQYGDLYWCDSCEHRFRYGDNVDNTVK